MKKAIEAGYKIIRLFQEDVYNNNKEWLDINLLPEIENTERLSVFISIDEILYDKHIELFETKMSV